MPSSCWPAPGGSHGGCRGPADSCPSRTTRARPSRVWPGKTWPWWRTGWPATSAASASTGGLSRSSCSSTRARRCAAPTAPAGGSGRPFWRVCRKAPAVRPVDGGRTAHQARGLHRRPEGRSSQALPRVVPAGGSTLLDALIEATKDLRKKEGERNAVVVISATGPEFSSTYRERVAGGPGPRHHLPVRADRRGHHRLREPHELRFRPRPARAPDRRDSTARRSPPWGSEKDLQDLLAVLKGQYRLAYATVPDLKERKLEVRPSHGPAPRCAWPSPRPRRNAEPRTRAASRLRPARCFPLEGPRPLRPAAAAPPTFAAGSRSSTSTSR